MATENGGGQWMQVVEGRTFRIGTFIIHFYRSDIYYLLFAVLAIVFTRVLFDLVVMWTFVSI